MPNRKRYEKLHHAIQQRVDVINHTLSILHKNRDEELARLKTLAPSERDSFLLSLNLPIMTLYELGALFFLVDALLETPPDGLTKAKAEKLAEMLLRIPV